MPGMQRLPQSASAVISCRIFPGKSVDEAVETINNFVSGGKIESYYDVRSFRGVIPAGVGIYTYGVSGIFEDINDIREYGNNDRIKKNHCMKVRNSCTVW